MARLVKDSIRCGSVQDEAAATIEAMLFGAKRDAAMSFGVQRNSPGEFIDWARHPHTEYR
jgi:hypothetical protein